MFDKVENDESLNKRKDIQRQIKELKRELSRKKKIKNLILQQRRLLKKSQKKEENSVLFQYHKQLEKFDDKCKSIFRKGTSEREEQTLKLLKKFENNLQTVKQTRKDEDLKSGSEEDDDNEDCSLFESR